MNWLPMNMKSERCETSIGFKSVNGKYQHKLKNNLSILKPFSKIKAVQKTLSYFRYFNLRKATPSTLPDITNKSIILSIWLDSRSHYYLIYCYGYSHQLICCFYINNLISISKTFKVVNFVDFGWVDYHYFHYYYYHFINAILYYH